MPIETSQNHETTRRHQSLEIALVFLVFLVAAGDPPPDVNEPHYLCRAKHYWNPTWGAGDLFLESSEAHLVFVWCFGWITKWLSLPATAWVGRVLVWLAMAWAWQRFCWRILPVAWCAPLAAALWVLLIEQGNLAGEWVVGGVEAKCFAYVFVLVALGDLVQNRWNRVWTALGGATAFHALVGGWSAIVCAGIFLVRKQRPPVTAMAGGLVVGGLLALAGILPALNLSRDVPAVTIDEANRIYVFERLPHHLAPLAKTTDQARRRMVRHGILVAALMSMAWLARQFPRTVTATPLVTVRRFAWGALVLSAAGFAIQIALRSDPVLSAQLLKYYWFRLADVAVPLALAVHATALLAIGLKRRDAVAVLGLAAALTFVGWQLGSRTVSRLQSPVAPTDAKMRDADDWVATCHWIRENTPDDAVFLTPWRALTFKWHTGRAELVSRKDIPQEAESVVEWFQRLQNVWYREKNGVWGHYRSPGHIGTQRILELADRYALDFVVSDRRRALEFPVVYQNKTYRVYVVPDTR